MRSNLQDVVTRGFSRRTRSEIELNHHNDKVCMAYSVRKCVRPAEVAYEYIVGRYSAGRVVGDVVLHIWIEAEPKYRPRDGQLSK